MVKVACIIMDYEIKVKSLAKSMSILECFTVDVPELGITEIANMLKINKSTVYNVISTFEALGYVSKNNKNNKYTLGIKLLEFSYIVNSHIGLSEVFLPYMNEIANQTGETVYLGMPFRHEVLYLNLCYPKGALPTQSVMGEKAPMYCTGLGKAMLAHMNQIDEHIPSELIKHTENTIIDINELLKDLEITRNRGYSFDNMEHEYGIKCIGFSIKNQNDQLVGAISVSGPSLRFEGYNLNSIINSTKKILSNIRHYHI